MRHKDRDQPVLRVVTGEPVAEAAVATPAPMLNRHLSPAARAHLRARLTRATRPAPGTSDLFGSPLSTETHMWNGRRVRVHDLSRGMTASSLKRGTRE